MTEQHSIQQEPSSATGSPAGVTAPLSTWQFEHNLLLGLLCQRCASSHCCHMRLAQLSSQSQTTGPGCLPARTVGLGEHHWCVQLECGTWH
jgi:hypothetical protein